MFSVQHVIDNVSLLSQGKRIWVAFSGGIDSHVLLHLLATSDKFDMGAVHVNHGLHPDASQWAHHCADIAASLNVPFKSLSVNVDNIADLGMEAAARIARYQALEHEMTQDDVIVTAQHLEDQAETVLLQLLRGAGPKGLSAMATDFTLGQTVVIRPLLNVSQSDIIAYAQQHQLQWVDDPSNRDSRWNRNYIRHSVWPTIVQRWPAAAKTIHRSAQHCAEADELMTALAQQDLASISGDVSDDYLVISALETLSLARYKNVVRYYIQYQGLPAPSTAILDQIRSKVMLARQDRMPLLTWSGVEVRRYQDKLYIMAALHPHDASKTFTINTINDVTISADKILNWQQTQGQGLSHDCIASGLEIRFRQNGERIVVQGQSHHKSLKHLFQQWAVPPWLRNRIPLIYLDDELIAVVGFTIAEGYSVSGEQVGYIPTVIVEQ